MAGLAALLPFDVMRAGVAIDASLPFYWPEEAPGMRGGECQFFRFVAFAAPGRGVRAPKRIVLVVIEEGRGLPFRLVVAIRAFGGEAARVRVRMTAHAGLAHPEVSVRPGLLRKLGKTERWMVLGRVAFGAGQRLMRADQGERGEAVLEVGLVLASP